MMWDFRVPHVSNCLDLMLSILFLAAQLLHSLSAGLPHVCVFFGWTNLSSVCGQNQNAHKWGRPGIDASFRYSYATIYTYHCGAL